jgi:glycosyltransferase involved in cell wall biosynthesis
MNERQLTAIVLTRNEAEHLPGCLRSLGHLTDDILVLDSGSTDATCRIATRAGARVEQRAFDGFASQRNAALDLVPDAAWVLFLDADERLTHAAACEIAATLHSVADDVAAIWLPRRNIVFGKALRGGGWWPDHQARLLRRGRARFDERRQVHETAIIDGASLYLTQPITHFNYASRREFLAKQRAYTALRVQQLDTAAVPRRRAYLGGPGRELWRRLVRSRGYRDGSTGLFMASVLAFEEARAIWIARHGAAR